jgi:hypothetical protein
MQPRIIGYSEENFTKLTKNSRKASANVFRVQTNLLSPDWGGNKEDIKEQPTSRNLSATATRVLQCTCPVAASRKYFSDILTVQRQQRISI